MATFVPAAVRRSRRAELKNMSCRDAIFSSLRRMVGRAESVKNSGQNIGLNFLSGVPLEQFVGKGGLTRKGPKTSREMRRRKVCEKFHNLTCFRRKGGVRLPATGRSRNPGYANHHHRSRIQFKDRGRCHCDAPGCSAELVSKKLALADADGSGLLRDRVNGDGRKSVRYLAVRF